MYWTRKHVLVCTASHCAQKGANELVGKLRLEIIRQGLDTEILVNNCGTIDLCDIGPNLVIYPDNVILSGVKAGDVKELVAYLRGEGDMARFETGPHAPAEQARRGCYAAVLSQGEPLAVDAFEAVITAHGFDASWIDEQARRGFIARKQDPDSGQATIAVTSKAKHRYSL